MIIDRIKNWETCFDGEIWAKAFEFLQTLGPDSEPGKYVIDGANLYAGVDVYTTKEIDECLFEGHRKYIDIQVLLDGLEFIDWAPKAELDSKIDYCEEADCEFFSDPDFVGGRVLLRPGMFAVFFPEDGHMPQACVEHPTPVKKVVVKVLARAVNQVCADRVNTEEG